MAQGNSADPEEDFGGFSAKLRMSHLAGNAPYTPRTATTRRCFGKTVGGRSQMGKNEWRVVDIVQEEPQRNPCPIGWAALPISAIENRRRIIKMKQNTAFQRVMAFLL